ncbi:adhesion G protein-coupled receptor E3-like [Heteronotia binoei]|uniref:adhesion G protein-coupled receptor E3-like n=1 Tax=Heteronotia binoei TaxID=13085 RepID=UPI00292F7411|nr:adhesion G protein-coupled receptor E3-like [Heteronotia binoei]
MRIAFICLFLGLGFLLVHADGSGITGQHQMWYDEILKYLQAVALNFQDCNPLDDEVSGFSGSVIDCDPDTIPYNASSCFCEKGYMMMTFVGINECFCEKIPYHCQPDIMRGNDNVMKCLNATKQNSLGHNSSFYCSVVESTFSLLSFACENDSLAFSLEETAESFEKLVNNSVWNTEAKEDVVSTVMLVMEELGSTAVTTALSSPETPIQTVTTKSVVIQTQLMNEEQISRRETMRLDAQGDQLAIHPSALARTATQGYIAVAFLSFNGLESLLGNSSSLQNMTLQNGKKLENIRMNSRVVSASTSSWMRNISIPINLTFCHLEDKDPQKEAICVQLSSASKDSAWTPEGCWHLHSNNSHSKCSCQYFSTYAVLMATIPKQGDLVLVFISYIGLIISIVCLFLSIVTFLYCRSVQNSSTFIHLQLGFCLFFADILFLAGIDKTYNKVLCSVVAGMLHYVFLACFLWMFLEGVNLYFIVKNLKVANYSGANKHVRICMYLCGYGIPALIVAISAASAPWAYGTHYHCWLNPDKGFHWSFLGPVCAIIVINTVFFCLILKILHEKLASLNSKVSTLKNTRSLTFKAIAHLFILGLTWCFGLFQFGPLADIMAYLFTLTNSAQGAFIFLVHCLLNKKVREAYWNWICWRKTIQLPSTEISMTASPSSVTTENLQSTTPVQQQQAMEKRDP